MSSTNLPTPSVGGDKSAKKARNLTLPRDIWEKIVTQYLLPECTWDDVEESVGWCFEMVVNPTPLRRIGQEWKKRAKGMRALLEALHVRSNPRKFCRGTIGVPYPLAILLGEIIEKDRYWRMEARSQSPDVVHKDLLFDFHIWWVHPDANGVIRRTMEDENLAWCSVVNPGIDGTYFRLWRYLNMLYERLSFPWKRLVRPTPSRMGFQLLRPVSAAINSIYYDIEDHWEARKRTIQSHDNLPLEEQVRIYAEGDIEPYLGSRTPWMKLDYTLQDTEVEEMEESEVVSKFLERPMEERPRKLYRQYCTWRELSILDRECSVDGLPWTME